MGMKKGMASDGAGGLRLGTAKQGEAKTPHLSGGISEQRLVQKLTAPFGSSMGS